uniref:C-type lectin domain-containing protein n=1 Tax=Plectus sambesii TaxID=2011161 RepID=A0A914WLP9_9BILA
MLFSLAILLFVFPTVAATTDLQAQCTGYDRLYNNTSCYVVVGPTKGQHSAKLSCNHYLGYAGHLVHIKSAGVQAAVKQAMTNYPNTTIPYIWTGLELINSSAAFPDSNNWGHYYRDGTFVTPTYLPWNTGQPITYVTYNRVIRYDYNNNYYNNNDHNEHNDFNND